MDIEVYSAFLLAGAIIGPRAYRNSVRPDLSNEEVITRFRTELQRMLKRDGLLNIIPTPLLEIHSRTGRLFP